MEKSARSGVILFACSALAAILYYLFFMMVGKRLSPEEYSALGFLLSFYFVAGVVSGTLYNVVVRYVSYFKAKSQDEKLGQFFINAMALSGIIGLAAFALMVLAAGSISETLGTSIWPVILLGLFILSYFLVNTMLAMMNGLQDFTMLGLYKVLCSLVLLPAGALLLILGTSGVLISLVASEAVLVFPLLYSLRKLFYYKRTSTGDIGMARYLAKALVVSVLFAVIINIDVILVRLLFDKGPAGNYAAAAFLGKLPLIVAGGLSSIFFPKVAELDSNGEDSLPLLRQALIYTSGIALIIFLIYLVFPGTISALLFSSEFQIEAMVPWLALAMGIFAVINVLVMYYLAKGRFSISAFLFGITLSQTAAIVLFHDSLMEVVLIMNLAAFSLAAIAFVKFREDIIAAIKNPTGYMRYDFVRMWLKIEHKR
jgi:O-antigen/teichoic acid export membrane protein